jgi:hypothetical protein
MTTNPNMTTVTVQINGKTYGTLEVPHDCTLDESILQHVKIYMNSPMWDALYCKQIVKLIKGPNLVNVIVEPFRK